MFTLISPVSSVVVLQSFGLATVAPSNCGGVHLKCRGNQKCLIALWLCGFNSHQLWLAPLPVVTLWYMALKAELRVVPPLSLHALAIGPSLRHEHGNAPTRTHDA